MWTDPKVKRLSPEAKLLFAYLITNQHTHLSGIYYLPESVAVIETGLTEKKIKAALVELKREKLCQFDVGSAVIWVVNMLKYQGRGTKIDKAVENQIASLHDCPLIQQFLAHNHTLSIPYRYPFDGVSPQDQDQDQDQEKEQEKEKPRTILSLLLAENISEQTARDFIQHRNKIKAPLTATALKGIKREAEKAKMSLEDALEMCCARGWRGFKAEWIEGKQKTKEPDYSQVDYGESRKL